MSTGLYTEHMTEDNRYCESCGMPYQWRKSTSRWLRMTYCSNFCEREDIGCTIEDILAVERFGLSYAAQKEKIIEKYGELLLA